LNAISPNHSQCQGARSQPSSSYEGGGNPDSLEEKIKQARNHNLGEDSRIEGEEEDQLPLEAAGGALPLEDEEPSSPQQG